MSHKLTAIFLLLLTFGFSGLSHAEDKKITDQNIFVRFLNMNPSQEKLEVSLDAQSFGDIIPGTASKFTKISAGAHDVKIGNFKKSVTVAPGKYNANNVYYTGVILPIDQTNGGHDLDNIKIMMLDEFNPFEPIVVPPKFTSPNPNVTITPLYHVDTEEEKKAKAYISYYNFSEVTLELKSAAPSIPSVSMSDSSNGGLRFPVGRLDVFLNGKKIDLGDISLEAGKPYLLLAIKQGDTDEPNISIIKDDFPVTPP